MQKKLLTLPGFIRFVSAASRQPVPGLSKHKTAREQLEALAPPYDDYNLPCLHFYIGVCYQRINQDPSLFIWKNRRPMVTGHGDKARSHSI